MSYMKEYAQLTQRYVKDKYGWDATIEELLAEPRHKRVWAWWTALAHYQQRNYYERLPDAPEGLPSVWVMGDAAMNFVWRDGEYQFLQQMTRAEVKDIYGE